MNGQVEEHVEVSIGQQVPPQGLPDEDQMAGAADGKELGESLYHAQDGCLKQGHRFSALPMAGVWCGVPRATSCHGCSAGHGSAPSPTASAGQPETPQPPRPGPLFSKLSVERCTAVLFV